MVTDAWRPSTSIERLRQRAQMMMDIRSFFNQRGYLEVETPLMARFGVTDVYLNNIKAIFRNEPYYLQTSPEYHMKRLLAAGSGPIFQLSRVFRDDELGRWHNPEFTMLEWYQLNIDHHALMAEVDLLLQQLLQTPPLIKKTYRQVFMDACGIDPINASIAELQCVLKRFSLNNVLSLEEEDRDQYLFLLMSHVVEPRLGSENQPIAVYDYPLSQASLAKASGDVAARFEVYYQAVELMNGFYELTDAALQRARFMADLELRRDAGLEDRAIDEYLLQALHHGLPACSGVALGVDRLFALSLGEASISSALAFDFSRA